MKKILQILLLSLGLIGCASVDLSVVRPSNIEADRILAIGMTHSENLIEAGKITNSDLSAAVIQELINRIEESDNALIEGEKVNEYAEKVTVLNNDSNNQIKFIGLELNDRKKGVLLVDSDYQNYFLSGLKTKNNNFIEHQLHLSLRYSSDNWRRYNSASFCDKWNGCEDETPVDIILISSKASGCDTSGCEYNEIMGLSLTDDFLRNNMETGFSVRFNSKNSKNAKKSTNKISLSPVYIKGYLMVAN